MKKRCTPSIIIATALFCAPALVIAQDKDSVEVIIEQQEQECMDRAASTVEMRSCQQHSLTLWDAELNRVYKALMAKLDTSAQESLRSSQRAWIAFRDKESALIYKYYLEVKQGTMWHPVADSAVTDLTRQRCLTLKAYLQDLLSEE